MPKQGNTRRLIYLVGLILSLFLVFSFSLSRLPLSQKYAGCTAVNSRENFDPTLTNAVWQNQNVSPLLALQSRISPDRQKVLGIQSQDKWLEIDLAAKKLTAHQGDGSFPNLLP